MPSSHAPERSPGLSGADASSACASASVHTRPVGAGGGGGGGALPVGCCVGAVAGGVAPGAGVFVGSDADAGVVSVVTVTLLSARTGPAVDVARAVTLADGVPSPSSSPPLHAIATKAHASTAHSRALTLTTRCIGFPFGD